MDRPPAIVIEDLKVIRDELDEAGKDYAHARRRLASCELQYERELAQITVQVLDDYRKEGARPPGEDARKAIAHTGMKEETWAAVLMAKADVDALDRIIRVKQSVLSGLQTELTQLRMEVG